MPNATLQHKPSETHDYPGRWRLVIDNDSTSAQLGLLVAARSRTYSAAATARLVYEAELLTPMGGAAIATLSGASGGGSNNVISATLTTQWQAVLSSKILASGLHMTHVGTYRVWARIYDGAPEAGAVELRLEYFTGDPSRPTLNPIKATKVPGTSYGLVDLGQVTIGRVPVGPQRWEWRILSKATTAGAGLSIDKVWILPVDEVSAKVIASTDLPAPTDYAARDGFDQTAGALTGKTLPEGGTWLGSGDANDLNVSGAGVATRTAVSDTAGVKNGRLMRASGTAGAIASTVSIEYMQSASPVVGRQGVIARYVDANNFITAYYAGGTLSIVKVVAGVATTMDSITSFGAQVPGAWYRIAATVTASGALQVTVTYLTDGTTATKTVSDAVMAQGGALASGLVGFIDHQDNGTANTRTYDNFAAWIPESDAVLYPGRSAELRSDGFYRQDVAGVAYSEIPVLGDLPRTPPAGTEGRTLEVVVKASRGDFESMPDSGIDDISARLYTRPSWLFLPEP